MVIIHPSEIRSLRLDVGLTQAELAEAAGVTQAYIAKIESGAADPKVSTLERISRALSEARAEERNTASQIMARPIISVGRKDSIEKAIQLMETHDISQIPVIQNNRQVGSIKEETIVHRISTGDNMFKLVEENVEEIMEDPFPTVGGEAELETIFPLLEHNPAVLVLEEGNPIGIITKADILRFSASERKRA